MSISRKKIERDPSAEPGLFDIDSPEGREGSLDHTALVKALMSEAIRRSPYKRFDIAYRFSCYLSHPVTEDMLNQLTSSKPEYQLKASQAVAFCVAVGNWILFDGLLKTQRRALLDPKDEPAIRLADAIRKKAEAEQELLRAQRDLDGCGRAR